ncbi:MAG: LysR family glycine cleavage system transcriptional activator [Flavobacteriales bacterium]|jgi:LysR family glycine cleavage system transcriptional activator
MNTHQKTRLPSLNILRVFECAARHLSFKKAASELFISPPAVSHQIRVLEEQLDIRLFERLNRGLKLSPQGEMYYPKVRAAIDQLNEATQSLMSNKERPIFVINSLPLIASLLLVPEIHLFQDSQPGFRIQIDSQSTQVDFDEGPLDVVIRHRIGNEPELIYTPLFKVAVTPFCSPNYFKDNPDVNPDTLEGARLIKLSVDAPCWPHWCDTFNINIKPKDELFLSSFRASVDAALSGVGIAMGYTPPINAMIKSGEIITPYGAKMAPYGDACLVYRKSDKDRPIIKAFEKWLLSITKKIWAEV